MRGERGVREGEEREDERWGGRERGMQREEREDERRGGERG
jgi:hypothetical protein